jgi:hypothetical protein
LGNADMLDVGIPRPLWYKIDILTHQLKPRIRKSERLTYPLPEPPSHSSSTRLSATRCLPNGVLHLRAEPIAEVMGRAEVRETEAKRAITREVANRGNMLIVCVCVVGCRVDVGM